MSVNVKFKSSSVHMNSWGRTPLNLAVTNGYLEVVKVLIDHGADIRRRRERLRDIKR